jgi:hypothetical protein
MTSIIRQRPLPFLIAAVTLCSGVLYAVMLVFHNVLPFQYINYLFNSQHFLEDPRILGEPFVFLRALGQYDAQWYLKIASTGYPLHPVNTIQSDNAVMDGPTYAFFPLYPLIIAALLRVINDVEVSAFLISNTLIIANVVSLYYFIQTFFSPQLAVKSTLLLFLFPFSIFFRSYFAEGLQLLLIIWFAFFMMRRSYVPAAVCLALLNVTKGGSLLLNVLFLIVALKALITGNLDVRSVVISVFVIATPLLLLIVYDYIQTGNPFYFLAAQQFWGSAPTYLHVVRNILTILRIYELPFNSFHYSLLNTCIAIITFVMVLLSRKYLPATVWWIGLLLWLTPFVSHDLMSFSRYQMVSFPLFIYAAHLANNNKIFVPLLGVSFILLLATSLFFVNWYWVG